MVQIHSRSEELPTEHIKLYPNNPDLDLATAQDLARARARAINKDAMLLSWYCRKTGEYAPKFECGHQQKPPWIIFAEARGGNLTIDIDEGAYVFIYLKL